PISDCRVPIEKIGNWQSEIGNGLSLKVCIGEILAAKKDFNVHARVSDGSGKNDARRARRDGMVPITVYGGDGETIAAVAQLSELAAILRSESGRNTIFTIDVDGVGASGGIFTDSK